MNEDKWDHQWDDYDCHFRMSTLYGMSEDAEDMDHECVYWYKSPGDFIHVDNLVGISGHDKQVYGRTGV